MVSTLFCNFHVWSLRRLLCDPVEQNLGIHTYHDKPGQGTMLLNDTYKEYKREWAEDRGLNWSPPNKRPEKLRDSLHDLEELLDSCYIVSLRWKAAKTFQLLLSNATLITINIGFNFADIEHLTIDKSLVGKMNEQIYDAIIDELYMVFSFAEKSKLVHVQFGRKIPGERKDTDKLNTLEPKLHLVDIPGPTGRKLKRKLAVNYQGDLVCVWWPTSSEEAWPWSPSTTEKDRSNLVLLQVSSTRLDVLYFLQTDSNPLDVKFSLKNTSNVNTLEQLQAKNGKYTIDSCTYEYCRGKLRKTSVVAIPSKVPVIAQGRNHCEDKLLLGCEDGTLILFDEHRRLTQMTKAFLSPVSIVWHSSDTIVTVCSAKGDIQIFDMALATIGIQLASDVVSSVNCLRLGQYFQNPLKLDRASWTHDVGFSTPLDTLGCYDDLLLFCERGPIAVLRFHLGVLSQGRLGAVELVADYVRHEQELEAVNFLNSMNWNNNGKACFACLTMILDYLFKLPFNLDREGCIEDALGSFYAPSRPLSESVIIQFRDSVSRLARRFFHHLLRHKRFEKAFLLAVDIGAKDLFMDIHYVAIDVGNDQLADAAKDKAMQLHEQDMGNDIEYRDGSYGDDENGDVPWEMYYQNNRYECDIDEMDPEYDNRLNQGTQRTDLSTDYANQGPLRTRKHAMMNPSQQLEQRLGNRRVGGVLHEERGDFSPGSVTTDQSQESRQQASSKKNVAFVHFGLV